MKMQKLFTWLLVLITSTTFASHKKLTDYAAIRDSFLDGYNVKMIVDLEKNCDLLSDDTDGGPKTSKNRFGILLSHFGIKYATTNIVSSYSHIGAPDAPYPSNYQTVELSISSDNKVNLILKIFTVPNDKVIKDTRWLCTIDNNHVNGIKFFAID